MEVSFGQIWKWIFYRGEPRQLGFDIVQLRLRTFNSNLGKLSSLCLNDDDDDDDDDDDVQLELRR